MTENQYGTRKIQLELLEMMKDIHAFCEENSISYSLSSGSVLGAVRHNGFIPWDDDMDIMVDRENFNKFKMCWNNLKGYTVERNSLWLYRIKKLTWKQGEKSPSVDIFIMDCTPNNKFLRKIKVLGIKVLQGMLKEECNIDGFSIVYKLCLKSTYMFGKMFRRETKLNWYDAWSQIGNKKPTEYVTAYNDLFKLLSVCYEGDTMKHLCLHEFEDTKFYIPEKFDSYLTKQYGNYMELPPENERIPMHM